MCNIIDYIFGLLESWLKRKLRSRPQQKPETDSEKQKINPTTVGNNNTVIIINIGDSKD